MSNGTTDANPVSSDILSGNRIGDRKTILLPGGIEMEFCFIPAGEFFMGSPETDADRNTDEFRHRVVISEPFWMGKYPVTQTQWEAVAGPCPDEKGWKFPGPENPAERISWYDCREFFEKLNEMNRRLRFALPTEAQWEYACRAGTTTPFSFGDTFTAGQVNFAGKFDLRGSVIGMLNRERTVPVGSLGSPNPWGLHDMHGNVWEWCRDWYDEDYYRVSPLKDPEGPPSGKFRVRRGGSWSDYASDCRSAKRARGEGRSWDVGFRVVLIPAEQ